MRKSLLNLVLAASLAASSSAYALGMGGINVTSALGQPLKADIELISLSKAERGSLSVRLASPEVYRSAGLEYPQGARFRFQVENRAEGGAFIKITSDRPVNDPFVSIMIELSWASGRLLREYTFLLDPPGYMPEQPAVAEVQPTAPAVEPHAESAQTAVVNKPATVSQAAIVKNGNKPAAQPTSSAATQSVKEGAEHTAGTVVVRRGDTLNKIADKHKPVEVSLDRMLVAMYRANTTQFDGGNMNRIKVGKILRLPDRPDLDKVTDVEATAEVRSHAADWNSYRQKLAGAAVTTQQPTEPQQAMTGKITSSVAEKTPKEAPKEVLRLSKGEAPHDNVAAGGVTNKQAAETAAQEDAIATTKAAEEAKMRAGLLEKNLKDMELLAKLKAEVAQASASAVAASSPTATPVAPASEVAPAAKPKVKPAPTPPPVEVEEDSSLPIYIGGIAAVLLGVGGLVFMLRRRKSLAQSAFTTTPDDHSPIAPKITAPTPPSPDTGDFTVAMPAASVAATATAAALVEDVDPISEADLFLNFGRDAQAEEILKDALVKTPENTQIYLKLLGIYVNRKDVNAFSNIARQLKPRADELSWQQAAAMGRKVDPGNPMYGDSDDVGSIEDVSSATMQTAILPAMPDFVLDDAEETQKVNSPGLDFDLGDAFAEQAQPEPIVEPVKLDVDLDMTEASESPVLDLSAPLDFDITSNNLPAMEEDVKVEPAAVDMDFNLDVPSETIKSTEPELSVAEPDFSLDIPEAPAKLETPAFDGLNLDFEAPAAPAAPVEHDEKWHEVATKLDLAKAYQEMGDATGAREILEEVLREGDDEQCQAAQLILSQIG